MARACSLVLGYRSTLFINFTIERSVTEFEQSTCLSQNWRRIYFWMLSLFGMKMCHFSFYRLHFFSHSMPNVWEKSSSIRWYVFFPWFKLSLKVCVFRIIFNFSIYQKRKREKKKFLDLCFVMFSSRRGVKRWYHLSQIQRDFAFWCFDDTMKSKGLWIEPHSVAVVHISVSSCLYFMVIVGCTWALFLVYFG